MPKKIALDKIRLDNQNWKTSESRAKFGIYVGNKNQPKLSEWAMRYNMGHQLELFGLK